MTHRSLIALFPTTLFPALFATLTALFATLTALASLVTALAPTQALAANQAPTVRLTAPADNTVPEVTCAATSAVSSAANLSNRPVASNSIR